MSAEQKVAVITGASRGIGAAIALQFAAQGAKVALHGRDKEALRQTKSAVQARGGTVIELLAIPLPERTGDRLEQSPFEFV